MKSKTDSTSARLGMNRLARPCAQLEQHYSAKTGLGLLLVCQGRAPAVTAPHLIREPIGLPYRFRESMRSGQLQYHGASSGQENSVANRYKNRFRSVLSSQDGTDRFTFVRQGRIVSSPVPWRMIMTDQTTLGTSDRGNVK